MDADTGRGIPLAYLRTTYKTVYVTDSDGFVAFLEPDLMNEDVWFTFASYGYGTPGLNSEYGPGFRLHVIPGASQTITLTKNQTEGQIADRLYRMTGYGVYRDSVLLGRQPPIQSPDLNARVTGSDTIQCAKWKNKLLWLWQDTSSVSLGPFDGNYFMTGATTDLPERLEPDRGLNWEYYTQQGRDPRYFTRNMSHVILEQNRTSPIWIDGLTVVPDAQGVQHMVGRYLAQNGQLITLEQGLVEWNDTNETLERASRGLDLRKPLPDGHPIFVRDAASGKRFVFYGNNTRVEATYENVIDPGQYEAYTCLDALGRVRRNPNGTAFFSWVKGGMPVNFQVSFDLVRDGNITQAEAPYQLLDVDSRPNRPVAMAAVGIAWNPYLKLWVNIMEQGKYGEDVPRGLGEIWFATAKSPVGPWKYSRKVATHTMLDETQLVNNNNDLYNPVQHYELMREGGRVVYFSGTFVSTFSGNTFRTPYYDYNNIMYRLFMNDSRLEGLPTPPPGFWDVAWDMPEFVGN